MAGFNTAISGIRAATKSLDVTGNNIANASTTGFKSSRTEFADIYSTAAIGSGSSNVAGSGVLVADIAQDFSGGNVEFTNNNLDLSIDGSGFFQLNDGRGGVSYTRSGAFELDKDGFIISKTGENLQGYGVDEAGNRLPIGNLQVSEKESPPKATEEMGLSFNIDEAKDASALIVPYNRDETGSYTFSTTVGTFDSLGNQHTIRYDMVEQQAKKELHTFDAVTAGTTASFDLSGVTLDSSTADFDAAINGVKTISSAQLIILQTADPRIASVTIEEPALATGLAVIVVTMKAEATEYGNLVVTGIENEVESLIDSNEVHTFDIPAGPGALGVYNTPVQFKIAGIPFSLDGTTTALTRQDIADEIIAKETQIRDANPNIESIKYDNLTNELTLTYKADAGDVGIQEAEIEEIVGGFFGGAVGLVNPDAVLEGDNSYEGVYRMYSFLNPLGQRPEALNVGKAPDPGAGITLPEIGPVIIKFDPSNGILSQVNGVDVPSGVGAQVPKLTIQGADPANPSTTITLDLSGTTQFANEQIVKAQSQDGYAKGDLTGVSFTTTGEMIATFSNSQSKNLGTVAIATFENQAGLQPSGNTQWQATSYSGEPVLNPPGSGLNGSLRSSALESSNVDLSAELVKLIEAQRNFQASSKTLETLNTVTQNILQI
ncbi:MAG: flagellar hook-basal body complex protein [Oceanospirillaceae bacterium]|nr:flagellar hook-basal body complex protein [Oceanospirillaceae bacterium]